MHSIPDPTRVRFTGPWPATSQGWLRNWHSSATWRPPRNEPSRVRDPSVAGLRLEDVDWQGGTLLIHGKGARIDPLPLPIDVGEAMVEYLRHGRPRTTSRSVFIRAGAPFTGMARSGVSCIVGRAAQRAGLGTIHAHRLRHTTTSRILNAGASLEEVTHLLRHASASTTTIYAKTERGKLPLL